MADVALMLSLSIFFDGGSFQAKNSPPCVNINIRRIPGIAQDVANSRLAPGWAEKSDEQWQRRWKISSIVEKNHFNEELTPPREKTKSEQSERRLQCAEWERHAGIGGRLPRMAAEAGADIAHGWHVFFVVGVYSMVHRL